MAKAPQRTRRRQRAGTGDAAGIGSATAVGTAIASAVGSGGGTGNAIGVSPQRIEVSATGFHTSSGSAEVIVTTPLTIVPTIYPAPPGEMVDVDDPVSVDRATLNRLQETLERLCAAVEQSNQPIAQELRDKSVADIRAAIEHSKGPRPSRKILLLLLGPPLTYLAVHFTDSFVQELAKQAADLLAKVIGIN
jgi:hypothetical protein